MLMRRSFAPTQRDTDSAVSAVLLPLSLAEQIAQLQKQVSPSQGGSPVQLKQQPLSVAEQISLLQRQLGVRTAAPNGAGPGLPFAAVPQAPSFGAGGAPACALPMQPFDQGAAPPAQLLAPQFMTPVKDTEGVQKLALPLQPQQQQQFDMRSTLPIPSPSLGGSDVISALQQQLELQQQLFRVRFSAYELLVSPLIFCISNSSSSCSSSSCSSSSSVSRSPAWRPPTP